MIHFIIPVFNDTKSLRILLNKLNKNLEKKKRLGVVTVVDDFSSEAIDISTNKLKFIKKFEILRLKKNVGSQNAIAFGLQYLSKLKKDKTIIVMDSDGEDNPAQINNMIKYAENFPNYIVTSNRTKRKETLLIRVLYISHLFLTFIFTGKWISFGNYTCFQHKNLNSLLKNRNIWSAYPAAVIKNNNIIRLFAARKKRFCGKSKISIYKLFFHSFRIISVFHFRVFIFSLIYFFFLDFVFFELNKKIFYISIVPIILFNLCIVSTKIIIILKKMNYNSKWVNFIKR